MSMKWLDVYNDVGIVCMPFNIFSSETIRFQCLCVCVCFKEMAETMQHSKKEMKKPSECDFELKRKAKCCKLFLTLKQSQER